MQPHSASALKLPQRCSLRPPGVRSREDETEPPEASSLLAGHDGVPAMVAVALTGVKLPKATGVAASGLAAGGATKLCGLETTGATKLCEGLPRAVSAPLLWPRSALGESTVSRLPGCDSDRARSVHVDRRAILGLTACRTLQTLMRRTGDSLGARMVATGMLTLPRPAKSGCTAAGGIMNQPVEADV
mmetsp:Transcript_4192/g.11420  ORF Transcript_4192/g.11420 Transcript_4192/m.11420 type:complete len:188 (-) Transcript_4192:315-878(-)